MGSRDTRAEHDSAGEARMRMAATEFPLSHLLAAKELADDLGGIDIAKEAVAALARLS